MNVLVFADIDPRKKGSFEDYMIELNSQCQKRNISIHFILSNAMSDEMKSCFNDSKVSFNCIDFTKLPIKKCYQLIRNFNPQVTHFHFFSPISYLHWIAKIASRSKVLVSFHQSIFFNNLCEDGRSIKVQVKKQLRHFCSLPVTQYFPVSKFCAEFLKRKVGLNNNDITILYNGIERKKYKKNLSKQSYAYDVFAIPHHHKIILFVGWLIKEKGIDHFIEMARRIKQNHHDVSFIVAGCGEGKYAELTKLAHEDKIIQYVGSRSDLQYILQSTYLYVAPVQWHEAFGLSLVEAQATGVPVVASNVGAIPEVIRHKDTGLLFPHDDIEQLVQSVSYFIEKPTFRNQCAHRAYQHAKQFDLDTLVERTTSNYQQILKR